MKLTKININKLLSLLLIVGVLGYYIPKTINMIGWLNSGIISGYFFLLVPVNLILIGLAGVSVLSFKTEYNTIRANTLMAINIIGICLMIVWYPLISSS